MTSIFNNALSVDTELVVESKSSRTSSSRPDKSAEQPRPKGVVLIADDSPETRLIVAKTLEFEGYVCAHAANGKEALDKIGRLRPDLVILDLLLPDVDGFQVLMKLAGRKRGPKVCIVSGIETTDFVQRAIDFGADDYIVKPVLPDNLVHKVASLLGRSERERFFHVSCDFPASLASDGTMTSCRIVRLSEVGASVICGGDIPKDEIMALEAPCLGKILDRDTPVFVKRSGSTPHDSAVLEFDFIGLPEHQTQRLRAAVIRGRHIGEETFMN